jgi:hypothetical protein
MSDWEMLIDEADDRLTLLEEEMRRLRAYRKHLLLQPKELRLTDSDGATSLQDVLRDVTLQPGLRSLDFGHSFEDGFQNTDARAVAVLFCRDEPESAKILIPGYPGSVEGLFVQRRQCGQYAERAAVERCLSFLKHEQNPTDAQPS